MSCICVVCGGAVGGGAELNGNSAWFTRPLNKSIFSSLLQIVHDLLTPEVEIDKSRRRHLLGRPFLKMRFQYQCKVCL